MRKNTYLLLIILLILLYCLFNHMCGKEFFTNSTIDCVIVHRGYRPYLESNLKITGKNNRIYLIGDDAVAHLGSLPNVTFIDINKYVNNEKLQSYRKHFTNYSSNAEEFEYRCFERVFIISLLLDDLNKDQLFHIDSDNVLLKDINTYPFTKKVAYILNKVHNFNKKNIMSNSIHCGLLNKDFCNTFEKLYNDIYITKERLHLIKDKIKYHKSYNGGYKGGGICDMTLYYIIANNGLVDVQDLEKQVEFNGKLLTMINMSSSSTGPNGRNQYVMKDGEIEIKKSNNGNSNLIYDKINKHYVDLFNIHFQGGSKKYLNDNLSTKLNY